MLKSVKETYQTTYILAYVTVFFSIFFIVCHWHIISKLPPIDPMRNVSLLSQPLELWDYFDTHGQAHVFRFISDQSDSAYNMSVVSFYNQLVKLDLDKLLDDFNKAMELYINPPSVVHITPFTDKTTFLSNVLPTTKRLWYDKGLLAIKSTKVCIILLAGGVGSRLGSKNPKGMYDIGLPSRKSLFQLQSERIQRLKLLASRYNSKKQTDVSIPWYIMTSTKTHLPTIAFFEDNQYFNLPRKDVVFFIQEMMPTRTFDGKLILESKYHLSKSPNGNGGMYAVLAKSGVLEDMKNRGLEYVHVYGVDNALVKPADPVFMGFSILHEADVVNKVVIKTRPDEKVGIMCYRDSIPTIVEYSELTNDMKILKDPTDPTSRRLLFNGANIANHFFTRTFLEKVATINLPYHIAKKKISYADVRGETIKPKKKNGVKLERFIFDTFSFCPKNRIFALAVDRENEFCAIKNAPGKGLPDSPDTALAAISHHHRKIIQALGIRIIVPKNQTLSDSANLVEISPLVAYDENDITDISSKIHNKECTLPCYIH